MRVWDVMFPQYGLASHKGYSTPEHLRALRELGPTPLHRLSFEPVHVHIPISVNYDPSDGIIRNGRRRMMPTEPQQPGANADYGSPVQVEPPEYRWYHKMWAVLIQYVLLGDRILSADFPLDRVVVLATSHFDPGVALSLGQHVSARSGQRIGRSEPVHLVHRDFQAPPIRAALGTITSSWQAAA